MMVPFNVVFRTIHIITICNNSSYNNDRNQKKAPAKGPFVFAINGFYWPCAFNSLLQADQNCGQVWPAVIVPAALAAFHFTPHARSRVTIAARPADIGLPFLSSISPAAGAAAAGAAGAAILVAGAAILVAAAAGAAGTTGAAILAAGAAGAAGAAPAAGATHLPATNSFHFMPAGTVPAAFMAFHVTEHSFNVGPEAAGAAAGAAATAAAGAAVAGAAAASAAHCALRKSFHFIPPSVPAALAALYLTLQSAIDMAEAWLGTNALAETAKIAARPSNLKVFDIFYPFLWPPAIQAVNFVTDGIRPPLLQSTAL
jgi:hypothetical protein